MSRSAALAAVLLAAACATGCASALREPPSRDELAERTAPGESVELDVLLAQAATLWELREPEAVRQAADMWRRAGLDHDATAGWIGAARAGVWLADHETDAAARRDAAASAVHAAQWCQRSAPEVAACDYWLALAVGVQARERRATAVDGLRQMVRLLESVIEREPGLEHAGPHRVLALVLVRAPGWPTGPGDPDRGLGHAREAVRIEPDYPPNQLCLAEALAANDRRGDSRRAYRRAAELAAQWGDEAGRDAREWLDEARRGLGGAD